MSGKESDNVYVCERADLLRSLRCVACLMMGGQFIRRIVPAELYGLFVKAVDRGATVGHARNVT